MWAIFGFLGASFVFCVLELVRQNRRKRRIIVRAHLIGTDDSIEGEYGGESKDRLIIRNGMLLMPQQQKREVGDVWVRWDRIHFLQEIDREMKP